MDDIKKYFVVNNPG